MLVSSRVCLWNHTLLLLLWFSLLCLLLLLRHLWFTFVSSGMSERRLGVIILESLVSPTYLRYLLLRSIIMLIKNHGFVSLLYRLSECFRTIMMCFEIGELAHRQAILLQVVVVIAVITSASVARYWVEGVQRRLIMGPYCFWLVFVRLIMMFDEGGLQTTMLTIYNRGLLILSLRLLLLFSLYSMLDWLIGEQLSRDFFFQVTSFLYISFLVLLSILRM